MRNLLKISVLSFAFLALASAWAGSVGASNPESIVVDPGMTEFKLSGEAFIIVTMQRLRINFSSIKSYRVQGTLTPLGGNNNDVVKFMWMRSDGDPVTLYFGALLSDQLCFDSDDVTGHNEKFD